MSRSEFEQIDEIKKILSSKNELFWSKKYERYESLSEFDDLDVGFLNGAWFMFSRKQDVKKPA